MDGQTGQSGDREGTLHQCGIGIYEEALKYYFLPDFEIPKFWVVKAEEPQKS